MGALWAARLGATEKTCLGGISGQEGTVRYEAGVAGSGALASAVSPSRR